MKVHRLIVLLVIIMVSACSKEPVELTCVEGTVIGKGCLEGSYAIQLSKSNRQYGIRENAAYDNVVETLNLPQEYRKIGTKIYFTCNLPVQETGAYVTYCTPAPQIIVRQISRMHCPLYAPSVQE